MNVFTRYLNLTDKLFISKVRKLFRGLSMFPSEYKEDGFEDIVDGYEEDG